MPSSGECSIIIADKIVQIFEFYRPLIDMTGRLRLLGWSYSWYGGMV